MDIDDKVDYLFGLNASAQKSKRRIKKSTWIFIGACIICLSFGASFLLPILNGKSLFEHIQTYLDDTLDKNIVNTYKHI